MTGEVDTRTENSEHRARKAVARDLPRWLCWGGPIASLLLCWLTPLLGYHRWYPIMGHHEQSILEIATVAFLLPAFVVGLIVCVRFVRSKWLRRRQALTIAACVLIGALGALYFGGEEMSWGQSYLHWETPDSWAAINKQNETNLHNLELAKYGSWVELLDDVVNNMPRQALLLAAALGAVLPVVLVKWRRKAEARNSIWHWLVPTLPLVPICVLAATSTVPEKIAKLLRHLYGTWPEYETYVRMAFIDPGGELKEYCYGMMILFYFVSLYIRTSQRTASRMPA